MVSVDVVFDDITCAMEGGRGGYSGGVDGAAVEGIGFWGGKDGLGLGF